MGEVVLERKGRPARLNATRLRMVRGTRWATRASIAAVIRGERTNVVSGSAAANPRRSWGAKATKTRIRIGCHVFSGNAYQVLRDWALA